MLRSLFSMLLSIVIVGCAYEEQATPQAVSLSGTITYLDRLYSATGFTGQTSKKPVRHALVELVDASDVTVATSWSDDEGHYRLDASLQSDNSYRVRVLAEIEGGQVSINNHSGALYSYGVPLAADAASAVVLDIPVSRAVSAVFNMLDVMAVGVAYVADYRSSATAWRPLKLYWAAGDDRFGTYFCPGSDTDSCLHGAGIYVSSGYDSDEFDDDILWHEFGHYIEEELGIADSPGGPHGAAENDHDLRVSWSEGLASYLSAAIKQWAVRQRPNVVSMAPGTAPTRYIDTEGSSAWGIDFMSLSVDDFYGCIPFYSDCYIYASNEIAVARVLWQAQGLSSASYIWSVLEQGMAPSSVAQGVDGGGYDLDGYIVNLEAFWDSLITRLQPDNTVLNRYLALFQERSVDYSRDQFEGDNTLLTTHRVTCRGVTATPCLSESRTLYDGVGGADRDVVEVELDSRNSYTIETTLLRNGADTLLNLYDRFGNRIATDDDIEDPHTGQDASYWGYNDGVNLRSLISYRPADTGSYFIEVRSAPTQPQLAPYAGRYGSYTLSVTASSSP